MQILSQESREALLIEPGRQLAMHALVGVYQARPIGWSVVGMCGNLLIGCRNAPPPPTPMLSAHS
ncbi:MAG: hypothetical protein MHMPM18_002031 [Marteilia pararefringens]